MDIFAVIKALGGIAMFFYGMEIMGTGLKNSSGEALKGLMQRLTKNTITGLLTGMLVTGIIQSSSATIVITVGLMAAGMITLKQSVSIVMGANIGTTITAQIIRLMDVDTGGSLVLELISPDNLAPLAVFVGFNSLRKKEESHRSWADTRRFRPFVYWPPYDEGFGKAAGRFSGLPEYA